MDHNKLTISIRQNEDRHRFVVVVPGEAAEGNSENYTSYQMCEKGIESFRANCGDIANYEMLEARNGQMYYVIKAQNHEIIFTSIMFWTEHARKQSVELLISQGQTAEISY